MRDGNCGLCLHWLLASSPAECEKWSSITRRIVCVHCTVHIQYTADLTFLSVNGSIGRCNMQHSRNMFIASTTASPISNIRDEHADAESADLHLTWSNRIESNRTRHFNCLLCDIELPDWNWPPGLLLSDVNNEETLQDYWQACPFNCHHQCDWTALGVGRNLKKPSQRLER